MHENISIQIIQGPLKEAPARHVAGAGALVQFDGIIRPTENSDTIAGLSYEVYEPMASRKLRNLAVEALERYQLRAVFVEHSEGFVPTGQTSFRLVVAATHRGEALSAMAWFIDTMKQDVPIWKTAITLNQGESA